MSSWCFTYNNYGDDRPVYDPARHDYLVYGHELAPTTGTPHLQGYVAWKTRVNLPTVTKWLPGANFERCKGTEAHNRDYCTKSATRDPRFEPGYVEYGTFVATRNTKRQGHRTDLDDIVAMAKVGDSLAAIANQHPSDFVRYHSGITAVHRLLAPKPPMCRDVRVIYLWGKAGTGKSRRAVIAFPTAFYIPSFGEHQWDDYNGEEVCIIDEFKARQWVQTALNSVMGSMRCTLNCRYNNKYALWHTLILVSNDPYESCVNHLPEADRAQFYRRVTEHYECISCAEVAPGVWDYQPPILF